MAIIGTTSFESGDLKISQNNRLETDLEAYIDDMEPRLLKKLLGDHLYLEFNAQLPTPTLQKWTDLLDGYNYSVENADGDLINVAFEGIKPMLRYFIWFYFVRDYGFQSSVVGMVGGASQSSENLSMNQVSGIIKKRYNKAVDYYRKCESFIKDNDEQERTITGVIDNGGGSYTIQLSDTRYLNDGDTVTIAGADYTVSNLVSDTSFDISGATVAPTTNDEVCFEIFKYWDFSEIAKLGPVN